MFNLSQRAWNNVIIFAMLFMVYLFSISNKLINEKHDDSSERSLLPEHSIIMKMDFGTMKIDRIGRSWRFVGDNLKSVEELNQIAENWQLSKIRSYPSVPVGPPYVVTLLLAGEESVRVYQLFDHVDGVIVIYESRRWLIADSKLSTFVPL